MANFYFSVLTETDEGDKKESGEGEFFHGWLLSLLTDYKFALVGFIHAFGNVRERGRLIPSRNDLLILFFDYTSYLKIGLE